MLLSYTPEEIGIMHDRNENFHGTQANFEKLQLYKAVKRSLMEFKERCDCVQTVNGYHPNVREKHAILWMDLSTFDALDRKETAALTAISDTVDNVIITDMENRTRITFVIQNIWER